MHRTVSNAQTGENSTAPAVGVVRRQRHSLNRGASTSTVPNRVCSRRVRRSLSGCSIPQSGQTRWWTAYAATWLHSMPACSSDSTKPISASVLTTPSRLNVASSAVFTFPALVLASNRAVHCITPSAFMVRHQPA